MIEAEIARLSVIPWAAKLITDKRWTPTKSSNRCPKLTGEDSFFAETLDNGRTIRSMLTLRPSKEEEGDLAYKELLVIVDLGDGLNGYPHVLHGGFAATLLDETCGGLIQLNVFEKVKKLGSQHAMNYLTACRCYRWPELSVFALTRCHRSEHSLQEASAGPRTSALYREDRAARWQETIRTCDYRGRRGNRVHHWRVPVY
jgi:hypothetical protein